MFFRWFLLKLRFGKRNLVVLNKAICVRLKFGQQVQYTRDTYVCHSKYTLWRRFSSRILLTTIVYPDWWRVYLIHLLLHFIVGGVFKSESTTTNHLRSLQKNNNIQARIKNRCKSIGGASWFRKAQSINRWCTECLFLHKMLKKLDIRQKVAWIVTTCSITMSAVRKIAALRRR